jgi:hypothetical protein
MPDVEQEVVTRLKNRRDRIAKMPPEQQAKLYSFAFNHFVASKYKEVKLSPEELEQTKVKWVAGVIGKKMGGPLDFETPKKELPFFSATRGAAKLTAVGAASAGSTKTAIDAIHNILDKVKGSPTAPTGLETRLKKFLGVVEEKGWDEAKQHLTEDELYKFGGLGHLLISVIGGKLAGMGAVALGAATEFPVVSGIVSKTINKAATGAAITGGGTTAFTSDPETITKWIVGGAALDALVLPGLGKALKKPALATLGGVSSAYERVRALLPKGRVSAPAPVGAAAGGESPIVGGVFEQIMKERYPNEHAAFKNGARLDQALDNEKFLNVQREAEVRAKAAEQAAREAGKPKALSLEEKAHAKAVAKAEQAEKSKAANALAKALTSYRKRAGNVPSIGSPHYERLKAGESVDAVLGVASVETEKTAIDAAVGVAEKSDAEAVAVAVPSAIKAVDVARKIAESSKPKPEPMFKASLESLEKATTPEEYAAAKQSASQDIVAAARTKTGEIQARHKAGEITTEEATTQALAMLKEQNAELQRIKTSKVPETISKKALDSKRNAAVVAQATRTSIKESAELIASDPESKMVENMDRVDKAKKALEAHPKMVEAIYKEFMKLGTGDASVLAEMLETALAKLEKK